MTSILLLIATLVGLLRFGYKYLDLRLVSAHVPAVVPFVEEITAAYGAAALLIASVPLLRKLEIRRERLAISLAGHVLLALAFSVAHTTLNWMSRIAVFGAIGRAYSYGSMPDRYAMELPMDVIVYALFAGGVYAADHLRRARQGELESIQLRGKLLEAELRNLRSQLEPHFLFNSLNTISETMYGDPTSADEMIGHLSALLRASLHSARSQEVPLSQELADLDHYLALLQARFSDRFSITVSADARSRQALVPSMILQPLVENAVKHAASRGKRVRIAVTCCAPGEEVILDVRDDGVGIPAHADPFDGGVGLTAARDRLRLLYENRFAFTAQNANGGGFRVELRIPHRDAHRTDGSGMGSP